MRYVKLSTPVFTIPILRQTPEESGRWGEFEFHETQRRDAYDYWVVCEGLQATETVRCPPDNVVFVTWEPPERSYDQAFVNQFAGLVTCHPGLRHRNVVLTQQGHPWHVPRTLDQLRHNPSPEKTRSLSVISSNKSMYPGHQLRLEFATALKERLGDQVDFYGRGIRSFQDKWEVLAPYRYSVAIENAFIPHWLTEKLPDCFLTETFPFYAGAPNAADYFPNGSFEPIDISDPGRALDSIVSTIESEDHYVCALPALRLAREIYLEQESLFPLLVRLLTERFGAGGSDPQTITLHPETVPSSLWRRVARRARSVTKGPRPA